MRTAFAACLIVLSITGCASAPTTGSRTPEAAAGAASTGPAAPEATVAVVAERFVSGPMQGEELDSLATWDDGAGHRWLIASAKSSHRLQVFDGDSGRHLRTVGAPGASAGAFRRPNGLAVFGDLLFVVERDNHRVQVLRLPSFAPMAMFGDDLLRSPYGLWLHEAAPGALDLYVTDSFMDGPRFDQVPQMSSLDHRVHRFRVDLGASAVTVRHRGTFGDTAGPGVLRMVESIAGDAAHRRLLIADEYRGRGSSLREYDFDGRFSGRVLPADTFRGEAEGVALWTCGVDGGYWIAVDQLEPLTRFHLFARGGLEPVGTFTGRATAHTDGIALDATASPRFPAGALYAVHADRAVAAFDLRDVVHALRLDPACAH